MEITVALFAIVIFIGNGPNGGACAILAFTAAGFCFIRVSTVLIGNKGREGN